MTAPSDDTNVVDVSELPRPERHPLIFAAYQRLSVGESMLLVNDHDPLHLREDFDREMPGSYGWEYVGTGSDLWRVRITKRAAPPVPRIVGDTSALGAAEPGFSGAAWKLEHRDRDLDSNLIKLPAGGRIEDYAGPDLDVLWVIIEGSGTLRTETDPVSVTAGQLVWLPARSRRGLEAGPDGIGYLTVHRRRQALQLTVP